MVKKLDCLTKAERNAAATRFEKCDSRVISFDLSKNEPGVAYTTKMKTSNQTGQALPVNNICTVAQLVVFSQ